MFVDKLSGMLPFLALGALGVADLVALIGPLRARARLKSSERGVSSYCAISTSGLSCCARRAGWCRTSSSVSVGNGWLAPGIRGTYNALSETFRSCSSYSRSGSRPSRLRRRAYGQIS
jgi:hypothetical protein